MTNIVRKPKCQLKHDTYFDFFMDFVSVKKEQLQKKIGQRIILLREEKRLESI